MGVAVRRWGVWEGGHGATRVESGGRKFCLRFNDSANARSLALVRFSTPHAHAFVHPQPPTHTSPSGSQRARRAARTRERTSERASDARLHARTHTRMHARPSSRVVFALICATSRSHEQTRSRFEGIARVFERRGGNFLPLLAKQRRKLNDRINI